MSDRRVSMADIAKRLGISTVTVSKALAGKDGASPELKAQIEHMASEMGYRKKEKTGPASEENTIGILMTERLRKPEHSFYWSLYLQVVSTLTELGVFSILEIVDEKSLPGGLPGFIRQNRVRGVMVLGRMDKWQMKSLQDTGLPLILLDSYLEDARIPCVLADNYLGAYQMTCHLIRRGHTQIGYVGNLEMDDNAQDRYYGYCKAMRKHSLPLRDEWVIDDRDGLEFRSAFDLPQDMPTAFFCNCDQSAYHFMQDLQVRGFRVPDDISVVGFYDHTFATLLSPPLTTFRIDIRHMATEAVQMQLSLMRGEPPKNRVFVTGEIVERSSVAPPAQSAAQIAGEEL